MGYRMTLYFTFCRGILYGWVNVDEAKLRELNSLTLLKEITNFLEKNSPLKEGKLWVDKEIKITEYTMRFKYAIILCFFTVFSYAQEPLRFAVTDLEGLEELQREFGPFKERLETITGRELQFYPVTNRTAVVEALRSERVEFVLTGPAEYVVISKLTEASPVLGLSRPDYYSSIVVLADSGIQCVEDLKGKRVVFGDVGSTSSHLSPMHLIAEYGLNPLRDIQALHTTREIAWDSLKRGRVDAMAQTNSKIEIMRDRETEWSPGQFRFIGRSPDLPNDILVAAKHVNPADIQTVKDAILQNSKALIADIIQGKDNEKYRGMAFVSNISDQDYNIVRDMYAVIGKPRFAEFVGE